VHISSQSAPLSKKPQFSEPNSACAIRGPHHALSASRYRRGPSPRRLYSAMPTGSSRVNVPSYRKCFQRERGKPASFHAAVGNPRRSLGRGGSAVIGCGVVLPAHLSSTGLYPGPQAWHWKEPRVLTQTPSGQEPGSPHSSTSARGEGGTCDNWI